MSVLPNGTMLSKSDALTIPTLQKQISKSGPETTWGSYQVPNISNQLADFLALRCKEACIHANTWIHAAPDAAIQLPWQWLPPSNNGATNSKL
jgi:hypothetical protein